MDIKEASEALDLSIRTIMKMLSNGQIHAIKKKNKYEFSPDEVARLKREREQGTHVAAVVHPSGSTALAKREAQAPLVLSDPSAYEAVGKLKDFLGSISLKEKLVLTLDEASTYSGLGKGFLRQSIESGKLTSIAGAGHRGATVVKRTDLEGFVGSLGKGRKG